MKLPLLESTVMKLEMGGTSLAAVVAIISQDQYLSTIGWALLGSILGGFVFTYLAKPPTFKEWFLRWMANICAGIVVGVVIASKYESGNPDIPLPFFTMLCAFFAGPIAVLGFTIGLPIMREAFRVWLRDKFKK